MHLGSSLGTALRGLKPLSQSAFNQQGGSNPIPLLVASGYASGVLLLLGRLVVGVVGSIRLRKQSQVVTAHRVRTMVERLAERQRIRTAPVVALYGRIAVPIVVGIFRPTVLLPASIYAGLAADELEAILAHELAHVRRWDLYVNLLQGAIEAMLFFHPAMWWVSGQIRAEREHCADELAIKSRQTNKAGNGRLGYARTLVALAEQVQKQPHRCSATIAFGGRNGSLDGRVRRIIGQPADRSSWVGLAGLLVAGIAAFVCLLGGGHGHTDDQKCLASQLHAMTFSVNEQLMSVRTAFQDSRNLE